MSLFHICFRSLKIIAINNNNNEILHFFLSCLHPNSNCFLKVSCPVFQIFILCVSINNVHCLKIFNCTKIVQCYYIITYIITVLLSFNNFFWEIYPHWYVWLWLIHFHCCISFHCIIPLQFTYPFSY